MTHYNLDADAILALMKPYRLADLYMDLEALADGQEGDALVKTQQIASLVHAVLGAAVGPEDARVLIRLARLNA